LSVLQNIKNLDDMPEDHVTTEMSRRMVVGKNQMLTIWRMKTGAHSSAHKHPEEQIFWILSGVIEFEIDGIRKICGPNDVGVIPGNTLHEAWVIEEVEVANIFAPVRDDYLTQGALPYMKNE
jgi:quercetin dioxygenase-like cupin family protein